MIKFKDFVTGKKKKFVPGESFADIRGEAHSLIESDEYGEVDIHHPSAGVFNPKFHKEDREAIKAYCNAPPENHDSSSSMSKYTRNRSRAKADSFHDAPEVHFRARPHAVHEAVKRMQNVFRPENTNKKSITSYSGLASKKVSDTYSTLKEGDKFTHQSVTSASTHPNVAKGFARTRLLKAHKEAGGTATLHDDDERRHLHVVETTHERNTCISPISHKKANEKAASLTKHEGEEEVTSRNGVQCTYHGKTVHTHENPHPKLGPFRNGRDGELGVKSVTVHHVTMHDMSTHKPVDINEYPHPYVEHGFKFKHPKSGKDVHFAYDEEHGEHHVEAK